MAEFVAPQFQQPDILGAFLRGRQAAQQQQLMPLQLQAEQQQIEQGSLNLQQTRLAMQRQQSLLNYLGNPTTPDGPAPGHMTQSAQAPGGSDGGINPSAQPSILPGVPQMPFTMQQQQHIIALGGGDLVKQMDEGYKTQLQAHEAQVKAAQVQAQMPGGILSRLEAYAANPSAGAALLNNPNDLKNWPQLAAKYGVNPRDLSDANVQKVATLEASTQRQGLGLPPLQFGKSIEPLTPQEQITNKNAAAHLSIDQQRLALQQKLSNGFNGQAGELLAALTERGVSLPAGMRSKEQQLATVNGLLERHPGATPDDIANMVAEGKISFGAETKGVNAFTTGKQGDTVRSLSVATSHLDTLGKLVDALGNGDITQFNKLGNAFAQQTGNPAPTNFDTAKNVVADEVTKAIIGHGGGQGDRDKAAAVINSANSPAELKGAIATYKELMGGQLKGLQRQYENSTGRTDFNKMVSPEAQQELGGKSSGVPAQSDIQAEMRRRGLIK